jgi:hypothetical protein
VEIQVAKQVNAPSDITFAVFSDITKAQERITGITKVEILSDVNQGIGTRWRETRIMFGKEATEEMEISALQPNQSYDVVAESHGTKYHTRYTFAEQQGGTRVEMIFSGKPTTLTGQLMSVLTFLFAGATRKALEKDMDELKAVAEKQVPTG